MTNLCCLGQSSIYSSGTMSLSASDAKGQSRHRMKRKLSFSIGFQSKEEEMQPGGRGSDSATERCGDQGCRVSDTTYVSFFRAIQDEEVGAGQLFLRMQDHASVAETAVRANLQIEFGIAGLLPTYRGVAVLAVNSA